MTNGNARRFLAAISLFVACALAGCNSVSGTPSTPTAQLRVIHGAPNAGNVDLYIYPQNQGAPRPTTATLTNVAYKTISNYRQVPAGTYTIDVEAAGASSATTPILTENVTLSANTGYSAVVAGEAGTTLQFVNFVEPAEVSAQSALIVHHASPFVGSTIQPVGVGVYDAAAIPGTPTAPQTSQAFSFSFTTGSSGPASSGSANGGQYFISPVPSTLPATLGLALGAPGTTTLASVAFAAPLSAVIPGATGFPANGHVSLFAIDASASSATLIGTVDP